MKTTAFRFALFSTLAFTLCGQAHAQYNETANQDYFRTRAPEVREVAPTPEELYSDFVVPPTVRPMPDFQGFAIDWNSLVMIGEKIIQIVQAGKPVSNVTRAAVSVVPGGVNAWDQLSGWQAPNTKVYQVTVKNHLNMTVVDLRLKVSAMYGGSINGRGKFLANVIVVPTSVYVMWGFNCDVWTEHRDPVNLGSKDNPVAGLGFDIRYRYGSMVNEQSGTQDYFVTGAGEIKEMR